MTQFPNRGIEYEKMVFTMFVSYVWFAVVGKHYIILKRSYFLSFLDLLQFLHFIVDYSAPTSNWQLSAQFKARFITGTC